MTDMMYTKVAVRPGTKDDLDAIHSIRKQAWEVAYKHIYSQDEIKMYFEGQSCERRTWPATHFDHEQTIVCYLESEKAKDEKEKVLLPAFKTTTEAETKTSKKNESKVIGYVKWYYAKNGKGEVGSLYVHPKYWNRRCGSMLWDHVMNQCQKDDVASLDIWVLGQARSKEFYLSKGCIEGQYGDYFIGEHKEKAVCYHKFFNKGHVSNQEKETAKSEFCMVYVDVIIPVHNAQETIEETVHSVMKQSIPLHLLQENVSVIDHSSDNHAKRYLDEYDRLSLQNVKIDIAVCCHDDGSTDKSFKLLQDLKDYHDKTVIINGLSNDHERISKQLLISQSSDGISRGAGHARNRAASIRKHNAEPVNDNNDKSNSFVCLLDSDDVMHEHRIAEQVSVMLKKQHKERNATLLGCTFKRIPEDSTWHYTNWANNLSDDRLLLERFREITVLQPTWMVTRHRFDLLGGYIESLDTSNNTQEKGHGTNNATKVYKLIHPIHDNSECIRLAEDLRFYHAHLSYEEDQGCPGTLQLIRTNEPLLLYRHRIGQSQSSSTSRKLLLQLRTKAFVDTIILNDPKWRYCEKSEKGGFVIWGAGRDGKEFFKSLPDVARIHVRCFVDVDEKKIKSGYYVPPPPSFTNNGGNDNQGSKKKKKNASHKIPIVHFSLLARNDGIREDLMNQWLHPTTSILEAENNGRINKERPSSSQKRQASPKRMKVAHGRHLSENENSSIPKRLLHGLSKKDKHSHKILQELKDLPVVVCVAMYRSNGVLEKNVENIGRQEGSDLWHFS